METPEALTGVKYVVWAEIERCDYENDEYDKDPEPEELGRFSTEEEARACMDRVTSAEPPEDIRAAMQSLVELVKRHPDSEEDGDYVPYTHEKYDELRFDALEELQSAVFDYFDL